MALRFLLGAGAACACSVFGACSSEDPPRSPAFGAGADGPATGGRPASLPEAALDSGFRPGTDAGPHPGHVPEGGPRPDGAPPPDADADADADAPWDYLPLDGIAGGGRGRRIGTTFFTAPQALRALPDGSSWLLWRSYEDPSFAGQGIHLEHFGPRGAFLGRSSLAERDPDGFAAHAGGGLTAYKSRCDALRTDVCFFRETARGNFISGVWTEAPRTVTRYRVDDDGNLAGTVQLEFADRYVESVAADGEALYALGHHGMHRVSRLDEEYAPRWTRDLFPSVVPPELPPDAPIEDLLRGADLIIQLVAGPVVVDDGVVVAASVARGTLAALEPWAGVTLPLPEDPRCADVVFAHVPADGGAARYIAVPTPECETLPRVTVVGRYAVAASILRVPKVAEPNDTGQYDITVAIANLDTGEVRRVQIGGAEDDWVYAVAPCGPGRACVAGVTGSRSVDTGSTVTYGHGFSAAIDVTTGKVAPFRTVTSPRHAEIREVAPHTDGLLFFATVNGPITHTADADPWQGFNEGLLGIILSGS